MTAIEVVADLNASVPKDPVQRLGIHVVPLLKAIRFSICVQNR
jgi:hypothetical protein